MVNTKSFKTLSQSPMFIKMSERNKKLVPTKNTKFLIFNLPSIITCPWATANCKYFCYAKKAEQAYPTVLPSRLRNLSASYDAIFIDRMIYTIETYLNKPSYRNAKRIVVRVHESGDFYNMPYMYKWYKIAEHFKHNKKVVFMAYTKSVVYLDMLAEQGHIKPDNLKIRFSVWDDTPQEQMELAKKYNLPIYTAIEKFSDDKTITSQSKCLCRDCASCSKCWTKTKKIYCEIH